MIQDRCHALLGNQHPITLMAGDFNAEIEDHHEFEWTGYANAFPESSKHARIPTYYADPAYIWHNTNIDHILYDSNRLEL
ncbi:unnamed protein product, partial [Rotaria magnacalcarata]